MNLKVSFVAENRGGLETGRLKFDEPPGALLSDRSFSLLSAVVSQGLLPFEIEQNTDIVSDLVGFLLRVSSTEVTALS